MTRLTVIPGGQGDPDRVGTAASPAGTVEDLYQRYAAAVFGRCRYLLKETEAARDATQEVFVKALRALPEFRAAASPVTWLLRIATYHCLNDLRAGRAAWREELARMRVASQATPFVPEQRELIRALLGTVSPDVQEMAVLYYVDELSQEEVAQVTGHSVPTVRKRLREFLARARGALSEVLPWVRLPEGDQP